MKSVTAGKNELGAGIYTVADISVILGLPQRKVRQYLNNFWDERLGKKLFSQSCSLRSNTKAVNFYVLIELFTFFKLKELGVSTKQILKSREQIAQDLARPYPFATQEILTDGRKIWYGIEDAIVNADGSRQSNFVEFIKLFCEKIEFDSHKTATKFYPNGKESAVVIDPRHQFGSPTITGTNINAEAIYAMYKSGEKVKTIGVLYDISEAEINDAVAFYQKAA